MPSNKERPQNKKDPFARAKKVDEDRVEYQRITKWASNHSPNCKTCNHADIGYIEHLYMDWATVDFLAINFGLPIASLKNHFFITGLKEKRFQSTDHIWRSIVERGMSSNNAPSMSETINALRKLEELEGKITERKETKHTVVTEEEAKKKREEEYAEVLKLVPGGKEKKSAGNKS